MNVLLALWFEEPDEFRSLSDIELVHRYQENEDNTIIAVLIQRRMAQIMVVGYRFGRSMEDWPYDVFELLYIKLPKAKITRSFGGWLKLVLTRHLIDKKRKDDNERSAEEGYTRDKVRNHTPLDPNKRMDQATFVRIVEGLLSPLGMKVVYARYAEGYVAQEVADKYCEGDIRKVYNICERAKRGLDGLLPPDFFDED